VTAGERDPLPAGADAVAVRTEPGRASSWSGRRGAAVAAVVLAGAFVAFAGLAVPWTVQPAPQGGRTPVVPTRDFTAADIAHENAFHHAVQPWSYTSLLVGLVVSAVLGLTPLGARLVRAVARPFGGGWGWQAGLGAVVLGVLGQLVAMPFAVHNEGVFRRYGLSTQDWGAWAGDVGKNVALNVGLTSLALLGFYGLVRVAPRTWWLWTAVSGAALVIGVSFAYPVVVEPLFSTFRPMPAGPLRTSLLDLAQRDGVHVSDVLVADASRRTTSLNAYVSGFGSTRRIVVYDTLLRDATGSEIKLIAAHELGHAKRDDVLHGTLIGALGVALTCCVGYLLLTSPRLTQRAGATGVRDASSVALVLFLVAAGTLVATPVQSLISRRIEARADVHSLDLTGDPAGFRDMQVSLSLSNLSDLDPNPVAYAVFADHPTGPERIALARDWARRHGKPVP
jgi:STE24 endopeptidase